VRTRDNLKVERRVIIAPLLLARTHAEMLLAPLVVVGHVVEDLDEVRERLVRDFRLRTTRPAVAEARLGLSDAHPANACPTTIPADEVWVQLYMDNLPPLDEIEQTFIMDGYMRSEWNDPRLRYNSTCSRDRVLLEREDSRRIWRPDLYFEDAVHIQLPAPQRGTDLGAGEMMTVSPEGNVFWSQQVRLRLSCPMEMASLPFDVQHCSVLVGQYSTLADAVRLVWKPNATAIEGWRSSCLPGWVATNQTWSSLVQTFSSGDYAYARSTIQFTRIPDRYLVDYMLRARRKLEHARDAKYARRGRNMRAQRG
jgi:hypothetical protein